MLNTHGPNKRKKYRSSNALFQRNSAEASPDYESRFRTSNFAGTIDSGSPRIKRSAKSHNFIYAVAPSREESGSIQQNDTRDETQEENPLPTFQDIHFSINEATPKVSKTHMFRNAHFPVYASLSDSPQGAVESPTENTVPEPLNQAVISATFQKSLQQSLLHSNRVLRSTQPIHQSIESLHTLQSSLLSHLRSSSSTYHLKLHTLKDFIQKIFLKMKQLKDFVQKEREELLVGKYQDTMQESLVRSELNELDSWLKDKFDIINREKMQLEDRLSLYKELIVDKDDTLIRTLKREEMQTRKLRMKIEQMEEMLAKKDEHYVQMLKQGLSGEVSPKLLYDLWKQEIQSVEKEATDRTSAKWRRMYISMAHQFEQALQESMELLKRDSSKRESKLKEFFESVKTRFTSPDQHMMYSVMDELKVWVGKQQEEVAYAHESDITQWLMEYDEVKPEIMRVRERFEGDGVALNFDDVRLFNQQVNRMVEIYDLIAIHVPKHNNVLLQQMYKDLGARMQVLKKKSKRRLLKTSKTMTRIYYTPPLQQQLLRGSSTAMRNAAVETDLEDMQHTDRERAPAPSTPHAPLPKHIETKTIVGKVTVAARPFSQPSSSLGSEIEISDEIPALHRRPSRSLKSVDTNEDMASGLLRGEDTLTSTKVSVQSQHSGTKDASDEQQEQPEDTPSMSQESLPNPSDIITPRTRNFSLESTQTIPLDDLPDDVDVLKARLFNSEEVQAAMQRKITISLDRIEALQILHEKAEEKAKKLQQELDETQAFLESNNLDSKKQRESLWESHALLEKKIVEYKTEIQNLTEERDRLAAKIKELEKKVVIARQRSESVAEYSLKQQRTAEEMREKLEKLEQKVRAHKRDAEEARQQAKEHAKVLALQDPSQIVVQIGGKGGSIKSPLGSTGPGSRTGTPTPMGGGSGSSKSHKSRHHYPGRSGSPLNVSFGDAAHQASRTSQTQTYVMDTLANGERLQSVLLKKPEPNTAAKTSIPKYDVALQVNLHQQELSQHSELNQALQEELKMMRKEFVALQQQFEMINVDQRVKELSTKQSSVKENEREQILKKYEKSVNIGWNSSTGSPSRSERSQTPSLSTILPALDSLPPSRPFSSPIITQPHIITTPGATAPSPLLETIYKRKRKKVFQGQSKSSERTLKSQDARTVAAGSAARGEVPKWSNTLVPRLRMPGNGASSQDANAKPVQDNLFHTTGGSHMTHRIQNLDIPTGRKRERIPLAMSSVSVVQEHNFA